MKKYFQITWLLALGILVWSSCGSSKGGSAKAKDMVIEYEITKADSDDPQMAMASGMMVGSTVELVFMGEQQKVDMNMMGGMMRTVVMSELKSGNSTMYMDMMGQKIKVKMSAEEAEQMEAAQGGKPEFTYTYDKASKKSIAGYDCYKVTALSSTGDSFDLWVTEALNPSGNYFTKQYEGLKGFPLEVVTSQNGFDMTMEARKVTTTVDASKIAPPSGNYTEMTMEELMQMGM